jgi:hypothetical protein
VPLVGVRWVRAPTISAVLSATRSGMTPRFPEIKTVAVGLESNGHARSEIDVLYTPLDEALAQLHQRRVNANLRATVAEFHRAKPPTFLRNELCAFFVRYIVSPSREFEHFVSTVRASGLPPHCIEFTEDLFSPRNPDKCRLCRPLFEVRPNHFSSLRILPPRAERRRLCDLLVTNGMTLPAFHRVLLQQAFPEFEHHVQDFSQWFSTACREQHYYLRYLALFICDGILFENFLADDPEELHFVRERVLPSFAKAIELFGVKPLIVPLLPCETECDERWRSYRGDLYDFAKRLLHEKR